MADQSQSRPLKAGDRHHRAWVGPPANYDLAAASQFSLLTHLGLREHHSLLDVGCGSLRAGRLLIPYLLPDRYYGIEPEGWLLEEGIRNELGEDLRRLRRPTFSEEAEFRLSVFGRTFDYVLAQSILSHTSRTQAERLLGEVAKVLDPSGVLVATWKEGPLDHAGEAWVYPGTARYRLETMRGLTEDAGLVFETITWPHTHQQRWFIATHARATRIADANLETFVGLRERLRIAEDEVARLTSRPGPRGWLARRRARR